MSNFSLAVLVAVDVSFLPSLLALLWACCFLQISFCMEVFIQKLLFHTAVVSEGTHFSAVHKTVSLKSSHSCFMEVVNMKFATKAPAYSCRSSLMASTSALFHRGGKEVRQVSYRTILWLLFLREGSGLQRDGCVVMIRSRTLSFLAGKSTVCLRLFTMSREVWLSMCGYWLPGILREG